MKGCLPRGALIVFVLASCHDATPSAVTLTTPQTSASQPSSSVSLLPADPEVTTKTRATTLVAAAHSWRATHQEECPIAQSLVRDGVTAVDAWARPFKIECDDDLTTVSSFGADGKEGTADDIRASM